MESTITVRPSRCTRMRFNKSTCSRCLEVCPKEAIRFSANGLEVAVDACSDCMLCSSVCPTGAFELDSQDVLEIVEQLNNIPEPVLGCRRLTSPEAHLRTSCFGAFSEAHLATICLVARGVVQLNLTECGGCENGSIADILQDRLESIAGLVPPEHRANVRLVRKKEELRFSPASYTRRGFFKTIGSYVSQRAADALNTLETGKKVLAYTDKEIPEQRRLFNTLLEKLPNDLNSRLRGKYFYDLSAESNCNLCMACLGACPTGALQKHKEQGTAQLVFSSALCSGCGLCVEFCKLDALQIRQGFPLENPTDYRRCLKSGAPAP